eukprot:3387096-Pleurochrysis_carterae.AAC.1
MRMIPTKDTNQNAQIKSNHRCAGIKSRKYVGNKREYETGLWNRTQPCYNVKKAGVIGDITQGIWG